MLLNNNEKEKRGERSWMVNQFALSSSEKCAECLQPRYKRKVSIAHFHLPTQSFGACSTKIAQLDRMNEWNARDCFSLRKFSLLDEIRFCPTLPALLSAPPPPLPPPLSLPPSPLARRNVAFRTMTTSLCCLRPVEERSYRGHR